MFTLFFFFIIIFLFLFLIFEKITFLLFFLPLSLEKET